jgi:hypothetical protein
MLTSFIAFTLEKCPNIVIKAYKNGVKIIKKLGKSVNPNTKLIKNKIKNMLKPIR